MRAPMFLRGTVNAAGETDILNDLGDTPRSGERLHPYRRVSYGGTVNINRGRKGCVQTAVAEYVYIPGVDGSMIWYQPDWEQWVRKYAADHGIGVLPDGTIVVSDPSPIDFKD